MKFQPFLLSALFFCRAAGNTHALPGHLDLSFGGTGSVSAVLGNGSAQCVAVQADGKIIAGGTTGRGEFTDLKLVRCNPDGTMDTSFNGTGIVITPGASNGNIEAIAIQSDGKIVAAAWDYDGVKSDIAVLRYNTDGSLDTAFNGTGKVVTVIGDTDSRPGGVAVQPDGKILVAGRSYDNGVQSHRFALLRYLPNGTPDSAFNGTGRTDQPVTGNNFFSCVTLQPDGKIVAAGTSDWKFAVVRYHADGSPDNSFNGTGIVTTTIRGFQDSCGTLGIQRDGRIVAFGNSFAGNYDFALVRYLPNGTLDTSFNASGIVIGPSGPGAHICFGGAIQADGKIVAAGHFNNNSLLVARYLPDGSFDPEFNESGTATATIGNRSSAFSMALQPDGKIVAAGSSGNVPESVFGIARFEGRAPAPLLEAWRQTHFGTTADAGDAADGSDPDRDGLVNLLEFATGSNPLTPNAPPGQITVTDGLLDFTWPQREAAAEILCQPEWTDALHTPWSSEFVAAQVASAGDPVSQMRALIPMGDAGRRFVRFRVARH